MFPPPSYVFFLSFCIFLLIFIKLCALHYNVVLCICRGCVTTVLGFLKEEGSKNRHWHWACWMSTGRKNGLLLGGSITIVIKTYDEHKKTYFAFCFRSCIILVRTPPLGTKGGWREGRDPPGLLRRQPHASIRKLESTPTPTGDVEILTPAGHTIEDSNTCKGNNPYAYLCTDTYKK